MKDQRKAEIVNELAQIAIAYGNSQQLRERISCAVLGYLAEQDRDTRHACAEAVSTLTARGQGHPMVFQSEIHAACMNARAL